MTAAVTPGSGRRGSRECDERRADPPAGGRRRRRRASSRTGGRSSFRVPRRATWSSWPSARAQALRPRAAWAAVEPAPDRVEPRCPHYIAGRMRRVPAPASRAPGAAGGAARLRRRCAPAAGPACEVSDPELVPAERAFEYRTKLTLAVSATAGGSGSAATIGPDEIFSSIVPHRRSRAHGALAVAPRAPGTVPSAARGAGAPDPRKARHVLHQFWHGDVAPLQTRTPGRPGHSGGARSGVRRCSQAA